MVVLPHKERSEEDAFKVELVPGKKMLTDGVNLMRLGTTVEPRPLKGWGYTYYEVTGRDVAMSTKMAAPPGTAKSREVRFRHSAADPLQQPSWPKAMVTMILTSHIRRQQCRNHSRNCTRI